MTDRTKINRREIRRKLGSRTSRRRNTKSPSIERSFDHKTRTRKVERVLRPSVRARVNAEIEKILNDNK